MVLATKQGRSSTHCLICLNLSFSHWLVGFLLHCLYYTLVWGAHATENTGGRLICAVPPTVVGIRASVSGTPLWLGRTKRVSAALALAPLPTRRRGVACGGPAEAGGGMQRESSLPELPSCVPPAASFCHRTHTSPMPDMSCAVLCGAHWKEARSVPTAQCAFAYAPSFLCHCCACPPSPPIPPVASPPWQTCTFLACPGASCAMLCSAH